MKEEIQQWKKENGNISYSTKELLQGLHIKIDNTNNKLGKTNEGLLAIKDKVIINSNNLDWHRKSLYGLYCLIVAIFWFLLS